MSATVLEIPPDLLALATDDELDIYIAALQAEIVAQEKDWRLNPRQQEAEDLCTDLDPTKAHELLYGGAAGGGKSQWMLWHLYHLALKYPGFKGLLVRRTNTQLKKTHVIMSLQRFDKTLCSYNQVDKMWKFTNGSMIEFGYLDSAVDVYNYDSAEYDCIAFDELTQWADDQNYLYLFSRIRTQMHLVEQGLVGHMIAGTNPGRVGGAWVKARFVDFAEPFERIDVEDELSDAVTTRVFVPAKIDDNPHFNRRQYRAMLMNVDAKRRRQLEDGDWDAIEGAYFTEWDRGLHVIAPFELPDYWTKIRGLDFGYAKPMGVLWACFDPDGNCYIYRELYGTGMVPTYQARRVNELTPTAENVDYTIADPSIWIRSGIGPPIAEQYSRAGLRCRKANNARVDGWMRVREYLKIDETTALPKLFVFDHCRNLIRTLPMLVHDEGNPEDLDTDGEDHLADALRYLLMSRPRRTRDISAEAASLDERHYAAVRKRRHDRLTGGARHPELGSI